MKHEIIEIPGFEGRYWVSEHGKVWSARSQKWLKAMRHRDGYLWVRLCLRGAETSLYVHRLVAKAFLPVEPGKPEVNHRDLDKTNNAVDNLEWSTRSENMKHAQAAGALPGVDNRGVKNGMAKLTPEEVIKIRSLRGLHTHQAIADVFGVSRRAVGQILSGERWSHVQ